MSPQTLSLLVISLALSPSLRAGEVEEAQHRQNQAANEYYRALRALGPDPTEAQKAELRAKTVLPAQVEVGNAFNRSVSNQERSIRQKIYDAIKSRLPEGTIPKWVDQFVLGKGGSFPTSGQAAQPQPKAGGTRNETGLDGRGVLKEIEFKRRQPVPDKTAEPGIHTE